jgi:hypothetical protein
LSNALKFVKWFFGYSGIMYAEEPRPAKKSLVGALKRLVTGAVQYGYPDPKMHMATMRIHRPLVRYKCRVCGVHFWSLKKRNVCWKWFCYKQA